MSENSRTTSTGSLPFRAGLNGKSRNRRGAIFLVALGVVVILTSVVLVLVQSMRTESTASANRMSVAQAEAVEEAAEMWVLGQIETNTSDAVTITTTPAEALQVGTGYFWLLSPDPTQDQTLNYGIVDEASKMNINANWGGTSGNFPIQDQLALLPNMTQAIADNITSWAGQVSDPDGATTDYYQSLPEPYTAKSAPFESVEELLLVEGMTPQILFGQDVNRNGVIEQSEQQNNGGITITVGNGTDTRGILNYVTAWSTDSNTTITGGKRATVDVSRAGTSLITLQNALTKAISSSRAAAIVNQISLALPPGNAPATWGLGGFYTASGMTPQEFGEAFDYLTVGGTGSPQKPHTGLINVNTASAQVLATLPGLEQGQADTIVASRASADLSNLSWFFQAVGTSEVAPVAPYITDRSFVYSADIVAVSGDGRAFKREKIVVNVTAIPAKIVYRKDLTSLGWPLTADIRQELRSGKGLPIQTGL
jgi:type II secretory pathway component PulK